MIQIRDGEAEDKTWAHRLNTACLPAVSDLEEDALWDLMTSCHAVRVATTEDGERLGLVMLMRPGLDYASDNYRWFCARYDDFLYVDRIMVEPSGQGSGVGAALYRDVFALGAAQEDVSAIACEVNLKPLNAGSIKFHASLGFVTVGEQATEGGCKRVSLMRRVLSNQIECATSGR